MIRLMFYLIISILIPLAGGLTLTEPGYRYPQNLPGTFTGGFGEETCRSCHFDYDLNPPGGSLSISWPPELFIPGESYPIRVTVESDQLAKAGFQLTARFPDGSQAGSYSWEGDRLQFTSETGVDSLQYLQHSESGTNPTAERQVSWDFIWTAPESASLPITFNIAANAGNDDLSPFGDWIYAEEFQAGPVGK